MNDELTERVRAARRRIIGAMNMFGYQHVFAGHSGGKDSCVIADLFKECCKMHTPVFVHTPKWDTHDITKRFLYELGVEGLNVAYVPKPQMEAWLRQQNLVCQIDGSRREEHDRPERSTDFVSAGVAVNRLNMPEFVDSGLFGVSILYPIVDWTDEDVYTYLAVRNIRISDEYLVSGINTHGYYEKRFALHGSSTPY